MPQTLAPYEPIPPGELLLEEITARGWTQSDFAAITRRPLQTINEIISGKKAITPETSLAFARALGTTPQYWLNLESAYRLALARRNKSIDEDISRRSRIYSQVPVNELLRRQWIKVKDRNNVDELEKSVCDFLEISSIDQKPNCIAAARRAGDEGLNTAHIAWFFRVKHVARTESAGPYSKATLKRHLETLRNLCASEEATKNVKETLAGLGVRFVIVEHLPQTKIDGGSLWLDEESPVVALSLRYDRLDYFWFTLMHEIAHILHEDCRTSKRFIVDEGIVGQDAGGNEGSNEIEKRANRDAAQWLIDRTELEAFINRQGRYFSVASIRDFAAKMKAHPAIVVGQLQYRKAVPWTHFRGMLVKIKPVLLVN
ncbi:MAG: HigA family addiction module antitoxin [Candidatus Eisenbacteria bacterium]